MESQSPETTGETPAEMAPELFRAAPTVGRPPSSTSTSAPENLRTAPILTPTLPAESSTSPDPSSSTGPRLDAGPTDPATSPGGNSPSEQAPTTLRDTIAHTLASATTIAHNSLTDDIGRAHHLYLATEEEVTTIADGASAIIGRRLGPVVGSSEIADVVQIVMAVGSYATRTFQAWKRARADRATVNAQTQQQPAAA